MVTYNDVDYFYVYHLQGDVVALIDANGTQVVEFRYREYVYDEETKLYYNKECGIDGEKSLNEVKGELK